LRLFRITLIIDEIGTKKEATAATDITQRGVQIIGTAHGTELKQVIENPELNKLIGGTHVVILGDDEANRRKLKAKSVLERMGPCAFDCAIELRSRHSWVIYQDLTKAVDQILQKKPLTLEVRRYDPYLKQLTIILSEYFSAEDRIETINVTSFIPNSEYFVFGRMWAVIFYKSELFVNSSIVVYPVLLQVIISSTPIFRPDDIN
jgi:hypothetical protein